MRRDAAYRSMQLKFGQFVAIFRHLTSTSDSCSPVQIANQCLLLFFDHCQPMSIKGIPITSFQSGVILSTLHFAIVRSLFGCFFYSRMFGPVCTHLDNCPKVCKIWLPWNLNIQSHGEQTLTVFLIPNCPSPCG